jgi:hypothetical protein
MVFEMIGHFLFKSRDGTIMYGHDSHTIRCHLTQEKNVYGLGVGISIVLEIFGYFLLKGEGPLRIEMTYISDTH